MFRKLDEYFTPFDKASRLLFAPEYFVLLYLRVWREGCKSPSVLSSLLLPLCIKIIQTHLSPAVTKQRGKKGISNSHRSFGQGFVGIWGCSQHTCTGKGADLKLLLYGRNRQNLSVVRGMSRNEKVFEAVMYFSVARVACSKACPFESVQLHPTWEHLLGIEALPFLKATSETKPVVCGRESPPQLQTVLVGRGAHHLFKGFLCGWVYNSLR